MSATVTTKAELATSQSAAMASTDHADSLILAQKIQRLRINRVAIIQELRVEHILRHLLENKVITQQDVHSIMSGKIPADRTRILIDLLPRKGKAVDWYKYFKEALSNPDTEEAGTRGRYAILVNFLDNAIIPAPPQSKPKGTSETNIKLPHYAPLPGIKDDEGSCPGGNTRQGSQVTFDLGNKSEAKTAEGESQPQKPAEQQQQQHMMLVKGFYHKWIHSPSNFASLLSEPTEHFLRLNNSGSAADRQQLQDEKLALERLKAVEVMFVLSHRGQLPEGFELCMSSVVDDFLADSNLHHLYIKYLHFLRSEHSIDIMGDIAESFTKFVKSLPSAQDEEVRTQCVKVGFALFELMQLFGMYYKSEMVLYALIHYLTTYQHIDTWMVTRQACVKILQCRNNNLHFNEAESVYNTVQEISRKIKLMSFTKDLLDESLLYAEMSHMFREAGLVGPAFEWAQRAMADIDGTNYSSLVDILCSASVAYSMKWYVKKAEELAVEAVKYAKTYFGTSHPQYVKALLHLSYYCSEFRQDDMAVDIARAAVQTAEKIYGDAPSVQTALSYQALAMALVANLQFTDNEFYDYATRAWRMALACMPGRHPRLAPFRYTLAQCLQWRANMVPEDDEEGQVGNLLWAEAEGKAALKLFISFWGQMSIKTAQAYSLLGQICARLERWEDAQTLLEESFSIEHMVLSPDSNYIYLSKAIMGTFYMSAGQPEEAIELLTDVVQNTNCGGAYLKWVHLSYDTLISLLKSTGYPDDTISSCQAKLADWMKNNPKPGHPLTWSDLHSRPRPYDAFYEEFNSLLMWRRRARKELGSTGTGTKKALGKFLNGKGNVNTMQDELSHLQEAEMAELGENLHMMKEKQQEMAQKFADSPQLPQKRWPWQQQQQLLQQQRQPQSSSSNGTPSQTTPREAPRPPGSGLERELRAASAEVRKKTERNQELEEEMNRIAAKLAILQVNKTEVEEQLRELEKHRRAAREKIAHKTQTPVSSKSADEGEVVQSGSDARLQMQSNSSITDRLNCPVSSKEITTTSDQEQTGEKQSEDSPGSQEGREQEQIRAPEQEEEEEEKNTEGKDGVDADAQSSDKSQLHQQLKEAAETFVCVSASEADCDKNALLALRDAVNGTVVADHGEDTNLDNRAAIQEMRLLLDKMLAEDDCDPSERDEHLKELKTLICRDLGVGCTQ